MIGVICPSKFEYRHLSRKKWGVGVQLIQSGMGKVRSLHACHRLATSRVKLEGILLIGYAGGLAGLKIGDVIEPSVFIEQDYCAEPFEKFPNTLKRRGRKLLSESFNALMLTQDRFLTENPYKNSPYAKKYRRIACDMESYAVAHFGAQERIPTHVIKLVSDAADDTAEHDFLRACRKLAPKLERVVGAAIRRF